MKNINTLFTDKAFKVCGIYSIMFGDYKYIGSSKDIYIRLKDHCKSLKSQKHHNITMQRLFNKYKIDTMFFDIVEICSESELLEREKLHISFLKRPYRINHILDPILGTKDKIYKRRLSKAGKDSFKKGREIHNQKETHMYTLDGDYVQSFKNATNAAEYMKDLSCPSTICSAARGANYTAYGYRWSYQKVDNLQKLTKNYVKRSVTQLSLNGDFIKKWDSLSDAQDTLKISNINRAAKNKLTAGSFRWKY